MGPEHCRQAVREMLDAEPTLSERTIAKVLGVSQKTINRDIAVLRRSGDSRATQPVPLNGSRLVTRGDSLVARLRGEMAEQGVIPASVEFFVQLGQGIPTLSSNCVNASVNPASRVSSFAFARATNAARFARASRRCTLPGTNCSPTTLLTSARLSSDWNVSSGITSG